MNKQEIRAAVAAKIAGQGNQVDIGGALGPVLNAIVELIPDSPAGNEPLIVEGTAPIDEASLQHPAMFEPSAGMPSRAQALAAFTAGRNVILAIRWGEDNEYLTYAQVVASDGSQLFAIGNNDVPQLVSLFWY